MGDTGSLILGTIVAILTIHFNESVPATNPVYHGLPAISLAIVIVPVIDTLRIFVIRMMQKKSPFSPDMNHIHHNLLKLTGNHLYSSLIIIGTNALIVLFAFFTIDTLGNNYLFMLLLIGS
jgi:UDP-N-acetylmuramyl pentapeptide phosphotransferase/UDP-N-acetylglucosamine-1-phosphate transferase